MDLVDELNTLPAPDTVESTEMLTLQLNMGVEIGKELRNQVSLLKQSSDETCNRLE